MRFSTPHNKSTAFLFNFSKAASLLVCKSFLQFQINSGCRGGDPDCGGDGEVNPSETHILSSKSYLRK